MTAAKVVVSTAFASWMLRHPESRTISKIPPNET
jgi:hypothetical protein